MFDDYNLPERPLDPPEWTGPQCPKCGESCELLYRDIYGAIVGCERCVDRLNAYDYAYLT